MTVAALYCDPKGVYANRDGVELWGLPARDAREYAGPWPVVAHPPCQLWTNIARVNFRRYGGEHNRPGNDGGCFAAALASVRRWGGVLEHPAHSRAWAAHDLNPPVPGGGWTAADLLGGWTCQVEQGHFGHVARKATWLYAHGIVLPILPWHRSPIIASETHSGVTGHGRVFKRSLLDLVSSRKRAATPPAFAELLLAMARSVRLPPAQPDGRNGGVGGADPERR